MKLIYKVTKIQTTLFLLICLSTIRCQNETNPCSLSDEVLKDIHQLDSLINDPFIQLKVLTWNKDDFDESPINWSKNETYRFKRSSSFGSIEIYRIEKHKRSYHAIIKEFDSSDLSLIHKEEKKISKAIWTEITNVLNENNFWTYPTGIGYGGGLDGAVWGIEGFKPIKDKCTFQNYHAIHRWSPKDSVFKSMCNSFISSLP